MESQRDLPKPELDLPLPEKEISEHAAPASQVFDPEGSDRRGETLQGYGKTNIFKSKVFLGFVVLSFLIAFLVGGFVLGKNNISKQTPIPTITQAPTPKPTSIDDRKIFCTQEAKLCPDGSYVSRTGPNCEFTPCLP